MIWEGSVERVMARPCLKESRWLVGGQWGKRGALIGWRAESAVGAAAGGSPGSGQKSGGLNRGYRKLREWLTRRRKNITDCSPHTATVPGHEWQRREPRLVRQPLQGRWIAIIFRRDVASAQLDSSFTACTCAVPHVTHRSSGVRPRRAKPGKAMSGLCFSPLCAAGWARASPCGTRTTIGCNHGGSLVLRVSLRQWSDGGHPLPRSKRKGSKRIWLLFLCEVSACLQCAFWDPRTTSGSGIRTLEDV